jgi:tetratricopeptide (TPR) repeat protein
MMIDHRRILTCRNVFSTMALVLFIAGWLMSYPVQALALGKVDSMTADMLSLYNGGKYSEAIIVGERILKMQGAYRDKWDLDKASTMELIGIMSGRMGNYEKATRLLNLVLILRETRLGKEHPSIAVTLNNIAECYKNTGNYAAAERLLERALNINLNSYGSEHPITATAMNNLAMVYLWSSPTGYKKAKPLLHKALKIRETTLGSDHPLTTMSMKNLSIAYLMSSDMGMYQKLSLLAYRCKAAEFVKNQ